MATNETRQQDTEAAFLRRYDIHQYDLPLTSVDVAVFTLVDNELQVLLVERAEHPHKNRWALPGGFIDLARDASLEDTASRKLLEKTGVDTPYVEQVCSVGGPDRDPRGWSVTVLHMALIAHAPTRQFVTQVNDARWWPWQRATKLDLAFDHDRLLLGARERLRNKTAYTALPIHVLDPPFTLTQLQRAFEALLGSRLEKKAFRRRMEASGLLEVAGEHSEGRGRPALLYRPKTGHKQHLFSRVLGEG